MTAEATDPRLIAEMEELRARLAEAEDTLRAIRSGEVDALIIEGAQGEEIHLLGSGKSIYRRFVETVREGTATLSDDGTVLSCDASLARTLGRSLEQVVGTPMAGYLATDDREVLAAALASLESEPGRHRVQLTTDEGSLVPVWLSASILHGASAEHSSRVTFTDLEAVVSAEEALRESEERYRELIEFAPVGMGVFVDDVLVFSNSTAVRLLGGDSVEQFSGKPIAQIIHPDVLEESQARIRRMISREEDVYPVETVLLRVDGTSIDVELSAAQVPYGGRQAVQVILADITERKLAAKKLRESENRYRSLFQGMLEGFAYCEMIYDSKGQPCDWVYLEVNEAFKRLTGLQDVVGRRVLEVTPTIRTDTPELFDNYGRVARTGHPEEFEFEFAPLGKWLSIAAFRPEPDHFVAVFEDITDRKLAEMTLLETNQRLERVLRSITETMGKVVEARDPYTQGHEQRVARLSMLIAEEMGLTGDEVDAIEMASLIHDVGKLSIPAEILTKPGVLSEVEFELIKQHSQTGFDILKDIDFDWPIAETVLQHHERMDGSGYPRKLAGDEISIAARVLAVADVVEAMASDRPYRPGLGLDAAMAEIRDHSEKYDPRVSSACVRLCEAGRIDFREGGPRKVMCASRLR